jgi:hypothetical protein
MKKTPKKFLIITLIALIIVLSPFLRSRYSFGVWNPLSLPDRIECYDRRYYIQSGPSTKILNENEKPTYKISFPANMTGKGLYTQQPKGEYVPIIIYLKLSNGEFQAYGLSGGP